MRFPSARRFAEGVRTVGTSMISAAFIAAAIRPESIDYLGAILLGITGMVLWYIGALADFNNDGGSS